jgi:transposase-like protein
MPKSYAAEFRRRVLALVRSGRSVGQLEADRTLSEASLFRWVAQDQVDRGERPGLASAERVEVAQAKKRIRELETELESTKKTSSLFAEDQVRPKGRTR